MKGPLIKACLSSDSHSPKLFVSAGSRNLGLNGGLANLGLVASPVALPHQYCADHTQVDCWGYRLV